jgi:regulation of enolase protein 1 (concanavalin A-like superfamily)
MSQGSKWFNEPPDWQDDGSRLTLLTGAHTDFWRRTLEDKLSDEDFAAIGLAPGPYVVNNGHLYYDEVAGDFTVSVMVSAEFADQYDQAGLMVRQDDENWIKYGLEVVQGTWADRYEYRGSAHLLGCSFTSHGWSEWSVLPQFPENPSAVWLRIIREGRSFFIDFSVDGRDFTLVKLCSLPDAGMLQVGRYATAPSGNGFRATFTNYQLALG